MPTTTTPDMNLVLPVVGQELDPTWAQDLNDAFTIIDSHDHTASKGVQIPTAGINIDNDLTINQHNLTSIRSTAFRNGVSTLPSSDKDCLYVNNGDLYYNNNSGVAVKVTSGNGLNTGALAVNVFDTNILNGNLVIAGSDTFTLILVNTSTTSKTITLPLANAVTAGRYYLIKDASNNAGSNNITIVPSGSNTIDTLSANKVIRVNNSSLWFTSDGTSKWFTIGPTEATTTIAGLITLAGDLGNTAALPNVLKINGSSVPAGGALTTGNLLTVTGPSTLAYSALDAKTLTSSTNHIVLNSALDVHAGLNVDPTYIHGTYTLNAFETILYVDTVTGAPAIINLTNDDHYRVIIIKDIAGGAHANPIQLVPFNLKTIDGIATVSQLLSADYGTWTYSCDAAGNWWRVA